jgi:hypothetical protein
LVHIRRYVWKVLCIYSFAVWVYVVAFQVANPDSVYWGLAWWLPVRLDYLGEAAFVLSFVFALLWQRTKD